MIRIVLSAFLICFTAIYSLVYNVVEAHKQDKIDNFSKIVEDPEKKTIIQLYQTKPLVVSDKGLDCLARNIFFEAGTENELGKYAVGQVTINRLRHGYWGDTLCEVVYYKGQFSWTNSRRLRNARVEGQNWEDSYRVAEAMLSGIRVRDLETALFYHADYVNPFWKMEKSQVAQVGRHIFYERAEGSWLRVVND